MLHIAVRTINAASGVLNGIMPPPLHVGLGLDENTHVFNDAFLLIHLVIHMIPHHQVSYSSFLKRFISLYGVIQSVCQLEKVRKHMISLRDS